MNVPLSVRSLLCRVLGWSDRTRWSDASELLPDWDERTRMIARLIPSGAHVIEFGAGRRLLERYLPSGCTYIPSDLVDRGQPTLVCDLNVEPRPDLRPLDLDTAVFGGVLEYIQNLESLVAWVTRDVSCCIASYECARTRRSDWQRVQESMARARAGWVNTFHEAEFLELFQREGFAMVHRELWQTKDGAEPIFAFERVRSGVAPDAATTTAER
jgi:hypothetical protein